MAESLTFLHSADLHIGAPFRGLRAVSPRWAERLTQAIPEAYNRMINAALEHQVDFVVIAGDIFDTAQASYGDYLCFFQGLERLEKAGIPSYLCTGNHDPYVAWQHDYLALPAHAHLFPGDKPGFYLYRRQSKPWCILGGRGYLNKVWPADQNIAAGITRAAAVEALGPQAAEAPFGVGVLHTGLNLDNVKAPSNPLELLHAGFDYWALGHVHQPYVDNPDNPRLVFSGCIQGRDIKETGPRGVNLVTLKEGAPNKVEFIPTASVTWNHRAVDISACETLGDVTTLVVRDLFTANSTMLCEEMVSRIRLTGATPLHEILSRPGVLEDLRKSINDSFSDFYCDALIDETVAPRDKEALKAEGLFPALFLETAERLQDDRAQALSYLQEEFLQRNLTLPSNLASRVDRLAEEAEDLVLDLLGQEMD